MRQTNNTDGQKRQTDTQTDSMDRRARHRQNRDTETETQTLSSSKFLSHNCKKTSKRKQVKTIKTER